MSGDRLAGEDLELFERSLAHATASASGAALDAELEAQGWADLLALDPRAAIDTLFTLQGAAHSTSGALDRVLIDALFGPEDSEVGHAIVLPRLGTGPRRPSSWACSCASTASPPPPWPSSSASPSARSRPSATASPKPWWLWRLRAASCDGAWSDGTPFAAMVAKATAGRSARLVARHTQQVLAGVGFTAKHAFHHYVKRALVLDQLLGDAKRLTGDVGMIALTESGGLHSSSCGPRLRTASRGRV